MGACSPRRERSQLVRSTAQRAPRLKNILPLGPSSVSIHGMCAISDLCSKYNTAHHNILVFPETLELLRFIVALARRHVNVKLSVCQGKSSCLDMYPIPCRKRFVICVEPIFMLFVIWVLRAISWRICRKHMKFTVSWPSFVSYQCLHAYAMYCPTPCSLHLCGSCT